MNPFRRTSSPNPATWTSDTLANLGRWTRLRRWEAEKGIDINPKADAPERRVFIERIAFDAIDPQANGRNSSTAFAIISTSRPKRRTSPSTIRSATRLWEPATGLILQTLAIPRVRWRCLRPAPIGDDRLTLTATRGQTRDGICSTAFLEYGFRTDNYRIDVTFHGDDAWSYDIGTTLMVHGCSEPFEHHDQNRLRRVARGKPNPAQADIDRRAKKAPTIS